MQNATIRRAIVNYKLRARSYRRGLCRYDALQAARTTMLTACGYQRAYSYMGEFCNLHERDFPANIRTVAHPTYFDSAAASEGRIYATSGYMRPVAWPEFSALMTRERLRARELQLKLQSDPADRFIGGWHAQYTNGDDCLTASYANGAIHIYVYGDFFDARRVSTSAMSPVEAREFFHSLPSPIWQECFQLSRDLEMAAA